MKKNKYINKSTIGLTTLPKTLPKDIHALLYFDKQVGLIILANSNMQDKPNNIKNNKV